MVAIFRNNQITTAIPLAIYVLLTHLVALFGRVDALAHHAGQEGLLYTSLFGWFNEHPFFSALGAVVLVFVQALLVNFIADEFRLLGDRNWFPGLFFALMTASLPDFLFLSPPLVATTFIIITLRRIFRVYKTPMATALIFDSAFWMTVGALFYPPAILMLAAGFFGLLVMRSFNIREQAVFFSGIVIPLVLGWLGFFMYDLGNAYFNIQFGNLIGFYRFHRTYSLINWLEVSFLALVSLLVLMSFGSYFSRKLIQTQKCISVLYWYFVIALVTVFLQAELPNEHFFLMMPSVGIFIAMTAIGIKRSLFTELFHLCLLGFVLFLQYYPTNV